MAQQQIAHFEIREQLGAGALGTVYLAWDTKLNRTVALKVLAENVSQKNLRDRFQLEARTIAALKHPNIVRVLDYSDANADVQFIALERLTGRSVLDFVGDHGPAPEQVALSIAKEVADALEYAHLQNVVHRDIKPDNVILENDRAVLIDFGAMRLTHRHALIPSTDVDKTPMVIGTPGFMAPEQLSGTNVDERADIFALGALLYYACTLQLPYKQVSDNPQELFKEAKRGRYRDPRDYQPLLTPGFCDLLADCLAPDRSLRVQTAAKLRERILALLNAHGILDVKTVLRRYTAAPNLDSQYDLRSVDQITRELKLALLRDLQRAVQRQDERDIRDATNRLRYIYYLFEEAEKYFLLEGGAEKPRLLRGRSLRRRRWFASGVMVGGLCVTALAAYNPDWLYHAHDLLFRLLE